VALRAGPAVLRLEGYWLTEEGVVSWAKPHARRIPGLAQVDTLGFGLAGVIVEVDFGVDCSN
jgi:hypothetical protein